MNYKEKINPNMNVSLMTDDDIINLNNSLYEETKLLHRKYKSFQYGYVFSFIILVSGLFYILHSLFMLFESYVSINKSILSDVVYSIIIILLGYYLFIYFKDYMSFIHDRIEKEIKHMKKDLVLILETQFDLTREAVKRNIFHTSQQSGEKRLLLIKKSLAEFDTHNTRINY